MLEVSLGLSRCEVCGDYAKLVKHHWYQVDFPGVEFHKYICQKCNTKLRSIYFGLDNHFLPPWEMQYTILREGLIVILKHLAKEFPELMIQEAVGVLNPYEPCNPYV